MHKKHDDTWNALSLHDRISVRHNQRSADNGQWPGMYVVVSHEIVDPISCDAKSVYTIAVARRIIEPVWCFRHLFCFWLALLSTIILWRSLRWVRSASRGALKTRNALALNNIQKRLSSGGPTYKGSRWPFYFNLKYGWS